MVDYQHVAAIFIFLEAVVLFLVGNAVGVNVKASGRPSASMKIPICTIGVRRFSFEAPGRRSSVSVVDL